jgi:hypothetical protein
MGNPGVFLIKEKSEKFGRGFKMDGKIHSRVGGERMEVLGLERKWMRLAILSRRYPYTLMKSSKRWSLF